MVTATLAAGDNTFTVYTDLSCLLKLKTNLPIADNLSILSFVAATATTALGNPPPNSALSAVSGKSNGMLNLSGGDNELEATVPMSMPMPIPGLPLPSVPDFGNQLMKTVAAANAPAKEQAPATDFAVPPAGTGGPSNAAAAASTAASKCLGIYKRCLPRSRARNCCSPNLCQEIDGANSETLCLPPKQPVDDSDPAKCPYTSRIEQILEPLRDGEEFNNTVDYLSTHKLEYVHKAAYRGDAIQNFQMTIRDVHLLMRENYRSMIAAIGNNIYPLIIASDSEPGSVSGVGGTFTLYLEDGSMKRVTPTSPLFELYKNLAHMPLGLFTIVSPYFLTPDAPTWQPAMRAMQAKVQDAITAAGLLDVAVEGGAGVARRRLPESVREHSLKMLTITARYIRAWLAQGRVTVDDFQAYTREMIPYVEKNIKTAAALQVQALLPHLQQWKDELGERWKDVYALIPTIWPVSAINPRMQVLSQLMSPEQVRGQVLLLENAGSVLDQRATPGRILGDRAAALLILGTRTQSQTRLTFALSTKQDLLANSCSDAIKDFFDGIRAKRK